MEVYSSSVEDLLIDGLSYKLSPGASYITERKSVSFFPSGSNIYTTASGTKVIRFLLNDDDWADTTNTLRIFFVKQQQHSTIKGLRCSLFIL